MAVSLNVLICYHDLLENSPATNMGPLEFSLNCLVFQHDLLVKIHAICSGDPEVAPRSETALVSGLTFPQ